MDDRHSLREILNGERDGDVDSFLIFLKDEGLELLAAYRAIDDHDVRISVRDLLLKIAFPGHSHGGGNGPEAA